jgi:hypothetical protein
LEVGGYPSVMCSPFNSEQVYIEKIVFLLKKMQVKKG